MMEHPIVWFSDYLDNEIDAEKRKLMEEHLEQCESCAAALSDMVEIKSQVAGYYALVEPPLDLEQMVMQAIEHKSPVKLWVRSSLAVSLTGVVCLAALWFFLGTVFLKLLSVLFKFVLAIAYVFSNFVTSIPSVYGIVLMITFLLMMISGISLRRLLRSTAQ
jgi:predicted anti-sigma-YlaC factor YlaD